MAVEPSRHESFHEDLIGAVDGLASRPSLPRQSLRRRLVQRLRGYQSPAWLVKRGLMLGEDVYIGEVYFDVGFLWLISIGDGTALTHGVRILAHDASTKHLTGYTRLGRVDIGRRVFIGFGAILLPGTRIGDDAIIGAGSVVRGEVPPRVVVVGNPGTQVATVDEFADKHSELVRTRPCYPQTGFAAYGSPVTFETMQRMRRELRDGPGYVG